MPKLYHLFIAVDLAEKLLSFAADQRITAADAVDHAYVWHYHQPIDETPTVPLRLEHEVWVTSISADLVHLNKSIHSLTMSSPEYGSHSTFYRYWPQNMDNLHSIVTFHLSTFIIILYCYQYYTPPTFVTASAVV